MKKILLAFCLLLLSSTIFAQQFSQYNTGTLYDSFENPSQKAFITDSSKQFAFNFLVPNFNTNFYVTGNAQSTIKNRVFNYKYDNSALQVGQGRYNHANLNANAYVLMLKMFTSLNGDVEMGFSWQIKGEGKSIFTDETAAVFNGTTSFKNNSYANIFNDNFYFQSYHQFSYTYREKIDKQFAFGFKLSVLSGIQYEKVNITNSSIAFDKLNDSAVVALQGVYHSSYIPGHLTPRDYLPNFRNPGASITMGGSFKTEDGFLIQGNVKDLGFIHWSSRSSIYNFDDTRSIRGLSTRGREDSIYNSVYKIIHSNQTIGSFTTPIDGRAEISVYRSYFIDQNNEFTYSPTLIASKELFYPGFTAALVNPFQYKKYVATLTATYDDMKLFNLGAQFMLKTPNFEFYIGTDKLAQSVSLLGSELNKSTNQTFQNGSFTGADFFLGFAVKFGPVIEHPMNSSTMNTGEKGFFGRLWGRIFKTDD
ncbi:DUF5723 family protein [Mucilaginibacter sp.]|uniref:DUF5723 family protein n=1 Tax=Mucilaginibacter sp. TaxID=1882438 RepID=UPI003D09C0DD